ncbi:hypothetical protein [Stenotrophomonas sp.]|uniref:hypothetical protein n=1 Tax=Stenotrophomonas sp. TaxID=69392 RepID=UPI0028AC18B5|nr:hypothetical protein [Stenotrophomonas sp.]
MARTERRRARTVAQKVITCFRLLLRFALIKAPGLKHNAASDSDEVAALKPPVIRNPLLGLGLQSAISGYGGALKTRLGLRLLLTGVRTGELRLATPDRFNLQASMNATYSTMRQRYAWGRAIPRQQGFVILNRGRLR